MLIQLNIPDYFYEEYHKDRFKESLSRLREDAHSLAGNYEKETANMLIKAFEDSKDILDTDDILKILEVFEKYYNMDIMDIVKKDIVCKSIFRKLLNSKEV